MAHENFTISTFSRRTGLSASALRFYESKLLLVPNRLPNGYRVYTEDQLETARLVHSLREAGISIDDIRTFLAASSDIRSVLLDRWRQEAEVRLLNLQISQQFLNGVTSTAADRIHLIHWDKPTYIAWKHMETEEPPSSFYSLLVEYRDKLTHFGAAPDWDGYVQILSVTHDFVFQIGFVVKKPQTVAPNMAEAHKTKIKTETVPPSLFVSVRCSAQDPYICLQITRLVGQFGYVPVGSRLDKYSLHEDLVEVMIPVRCDTRTRHRSY